MALFFPDDASYDETVRMTGFYRYRQLLSMYTFGWMKVNLITVAGSIPLAAGITISILSSSLLLLIPLSLLGGMILGPFLASMFDAILRGMRDAPGHWWRSFKKSFRQNLVDSLLPGAFTGLTTGIYAFMIYLLWTANSLPGTMPLLLTAFSLLLVLILIPFLGFWFPIFLAEFTIYRYLDEELQIEARIAEHLGYPREDEHNDDLTS